MSDQPPAPASFELVLLDEALAFVQPLVQAAESEAVLADMLAVLGWNSTEIGFATSALSGIHTAIDAVQDIIDTLSKPDAEITLGTLVDSLVATEGMVQAVIAIEHALNPPPPGFDAFGGQLLEFLTTTWLRTRHATIYEAMTLLTLVTPASKQLPAADAVVSTTSGEIISFPTLQDQLALEQLGKLLTDPVGTLRAAYVPTGVSGQDFADGLADSVLPAAGRLLQQFGAQASYGANAVGGVELGANAARAAHILAFWFEFGGDGAGASVMLRPTPGQATGTDVGVAPFGTLVFKDTVGSWMFELKLDGTLYPVFFGPDGVVFDPPGGKLTARARLVKLSAGSGPVVLIGSDKATRLEIGALSLELDGSLNTSGDWDVGFLTRAQHALVAVAGGDGDGFLAKVLPAPGLQIPFDLGVGWSRTKGLYFEGGVTIKVDLPLHLSLFDVLKIEEIELAVTPLFATPPGVMIDAGVTAGLTIGPFSAEVEKIGLRTTMTFPQGTGGNVGPVQFQLGFKPPTGAGLSLDAGVVGGGGFLSFDDPEYAGILELEALDTIALKVIGLISTRMPSGQRGFSLLLIITAEFPPIQLGYGFTLNGVGGIIGANRTMAIDVLRTDLHTGALESILFPPDPVAHAQEVISNLREGFPVAEGRFMLGPMAKLGWGSPSLITLELGFIVELPMPLRIALLGRLAIALPDPEDAVVLLQLDILGLLDFGTGDVSFDATLHDSRITEFPITGDMALRANVGSHPAFAMSAGGFHPSFPAPADFPKMERLGISLGDSDNPRVRLEAYFALTTNSVQTGAHVDIYASLDAGVAGTFSILAQLAFDAIVHFSPFSLAADFSAGVDLKRNGDSIATIWLEMHLTAPTPWHAWGKATINFFGSHEFDVSVTAGSLPPPPPPAAIDVLNDKLLHDLNASVSWAGTMPDEGHMLVTLRGAPDDGTVRVHPLGGLGVHERSVPLGLTIDRFGTAPVSGARRFSIGGAMVDGHPVDPTQITPITDRFAPGQFLALSDDQLLARPAFEVLSAGAQIPLTQSAQSAAPQPGDLSYETFVVDDVPADPPTTPYTLSPDLMAALAGTGPAARGSMRIPGARQLEGAGAPMTQPGWTVARTDTLAPAHSGHPLAFDGPVSHAQAAQALDNYDAGHPADKGTWQVVEDHEAVSA
ncbi:MAG: DUF6603 domain-containing protein [Solirubrobacteraceae bacterium]